MKNTEIEKYLLIGSKSETLYGAYIDSYDVASNRIKRKVWPLYCRTAFAKKIKDEDICYVYVANSKQYGGAIIATFQVQSISTKVQNWFETEELLTDQPERILHMANIKLASPPLPVKPLAPNLDFTNRTDNNWGAYMQGGAKKINHHDFALINSKLKLAVQ